MRLHDLKTTSQNKKARRVGRGISAGQGKTCGRGTKGQKARTGANSNIPRTFEGGATSLIQRMPKLKGFKSHADKLLTVNLKRIEQVFAQGDKVNIVSLIEKGIVNDTEAMKGIKIVGVPSTEKLAFAFDLEDNSLTFSKKLEQIIKPESTK